MKPIMNKQTSIEKVVKLSIDETRDELSCLSLEEELYKQVIADKKCDLFTKPDSMIEDVEFNYSMSEKQVKSWIDDIQKQKARLQYELDFYKKRRDEIKAKKQKRMDEEALNDLNKCPKAISEDELKPIKK